MELLVFGHGGTPMLVFPSSKGRFFEYEDAGMIGAVAYQLENGLNQVFCPDGVDDESWYNYGAHPGYRVYRHMQYDAYILNEVLPLIRAINGNQYLIATGCSFGAYHAANLAFRHPDLVDKLICLSGGYDVHQYIHGYYDDNAYFNAPFDYLPNLNDGWYLDKLRQMRIILGTGEHDICLQDNLHLSNLLNAKGINHWLDIWGDGMQHDWPWWRPMIAKYIGA
jgi:esterase/lipase superfamily enzyme